MPQIQPDRVIYLYPVHNVCINEPPACTTRLTSLPSHFRAGHLKVNRAIYIFKASPQPYVALCWKGRPYFIKPCKTSQKIRGQLFGTVPHSKPIAFFENQKMYSLLKYKYLIIYQFLQIQDMMLAQLGRLLGLTMPPCQALQPLQRRKSHIDVPNTGYRHSTGAFARTGGRMDELITPIILGWNI